MDIEKWLRGLGLQQYAAAFRDNAVDAEILPELTDVDLEKLGVVLGHRKRLLKAIAALAAPAAAMQATSVGSAPSHGHDAERRQLTVMFADLVGSTALSARLDPEELRDIIGTYHRRCAEVITRSGGFVAKYLGDGVLAYFGYPQAHEEDAEQAVRAGLALIEAVAKLDGPSTSLRVRVGVATGLVVVGDLLGEGAAQEQAVIGETPNLAARLQGLAEPNTVVVAEVTRRMLGGLFDYRDLGTLPVAGIDYPVHVWQVLGASQVGSRFEALRAASTPLIGREEEIALLTRRWERAKAGDGSVVLIVGEPGIGKSRIAQTLLERLAKEPHTRLRFFCSPHHQHTPFYPSITQLQEAAGFKREDTPETRLAKLVAVLSMANKDLSEAVPLLADLLSIPTGDRYPPLNFTPQKRKAKTLQVQLAQAEGLAARQPLLMLWEDIHWSDPTTLESLDLLIDRAATLRVLMILTFRPEFTPPWVGRPHVNLLSLSRLAPRQSAEMIIRVNGGKALPKEITQQIIDRTDGVPLFIEELTKSVLESGMVTKGRDGYTVMELVVPLAIPMTLHASLLARLDRHAAVREVAQIGAALGRRFSHELISAVAGMPQPQLEDALAQLIGAGLIFRRGAPPDAEYTFKHALVQDAAYGTLLRPSRRALHRRIAEALETQFPEAATAQPEVLAQHCAEAGLIDKAVGYRLTAGQKAVARSAMTEAVSQLSKGLDLLSGLSSSDSRHQQELDLLIPLGQALIATKGFGASVVTEVLARARNLCEQLNRPPQLVPVLWGQWVQHLIRGELTVARQRAEEIRQLGEVRGDGALLLMGCRIRGRSNHFLGEFTAASIDQERALSHFDPAQRDFYAALFPNDLYVSLLADSSQTLVCLGQVDKARRRFEQAIQEARLLSHAYSLAYALCNGWISQWGVRADRDMLQYAEELVSVTADHGFRHFAAMGIMMRGWCLARLGQQIEGIQQLTDGMAKYHDIATETKLNLPFFLTLLADSHDRARAPEEGLKCLTEAALLIESTQERWVLAEIHRLRGQLQKAAGNGAAAEMSFYEAIQVAQRQGAELWELRAATSLARLWRDQNKRTEARDLLAPVYGWFTEGFDTPDLQEAKALLIELHK